MKKLLVFLFLTIIFTGSAFAVERTGLLATQGTASNAGTVKTQLDASKVTSLQERARTEITRRITFLNELSAKIDNIKKISDADKTTLKSQIQEQVAGLNTLQTKIDADTDLTILRADVKQIINGYYIFAFFRVKISLLVASDRLLTATNNMTIVYNKLLTRVTAEKNQGKDVASLEKLLTDMQSKITDATTQYQAAQTELTSLAAQDFPGNKSKLLDARTKIKAGASDLKAANQDALKIRESLGDITGNLKPKVGTNSALEKNSTEQ